MNMNVNSLSFNPLSFLAQQNTNQSYFQNNLSSIFPGNNTGFGGSSFSSNYFGFNPLQMIYSTLMNLLMNVMNRFCPSYGSSPGYGDRMYIQEMQSKYIAENFDELKEIDGNRTGLVDIDDFKSILNNPEDGYSFKKILFAQNILRNDSVIHLADFALNGTGENAHDSGNVKAEYEAVNAWYENKSDITESLNYLKANFTEIAELDISTNDNNYVLSLEDLEKLKNGALGDKGEEIAETLFTAFGGNENYGKLAFGLANASGSNLESKYDTEDKDKDFRISLDGLNLFKHYFTGN